MNRPRYLLIGNPASRRVERFEQAIHPFAVDFQLIPWLEIIRCRGNLDSFRAFDTPALVRLESPGREPEVARALIGTALEAFPDAEPIDWRNLEMPRARIVHPRLMYEGFRRILLPLHESFQSRSHLQILSAPLEVIEMFDKNLTGDRFERFALPTPERLAVETTGQFPWEKIDAAGWSSCFVKLNTGSSASGIVQVTTACDREPTGISTMVRLRGHYYNTRRLCRLHGDGLDDVLGFLMQQGICLQCGIRKTEIDGLNFDVRIIVIDRKPRFSIFRVSPHPMTNLHLGGSRGEEERCRKLIHQRIWLDALDQCVALSESYTSQMLGIDLLFERNTFQPYFLEVNAFGDFFPDYRDAEGKPIHEIEIENALQRMKS